MRQIYSMKMAIYLMEKGFKAESITVNPFKPEFKMWIFKETQELLDAMSNYKK